MIPAWMSYLGLDEMDDAKEIALTIVNYRRKQYEDAVEYFPRYRAYIDKLDRLFEFIFDYEFRSENLREQLKEIADEIRSKFGYNEPYNTIIDDILLIAMRR